MIHLGVRSIPKVLSWFQTQTAGTHTLTGTHRWYIGMLPLKLKVSPWPASSRAETPNPSPKRRIEGGCSTSKTLACPEKVFVVISGKDAPQETDHQGNAKKKNLPGMRDTSWQMSLHVRLGIAEKSPKQKDVTTSCWGQLPYIPKWLPLCVGGPKPPKKKTCWSQNFESKKQDKTPNLREDLRNPLFWGLPIYHLFPHLGELGEGGDSDSIFNKNCPNGVKKDQKYQHLPFSTPLSSIQHPNWKIQVRMPDVVRNKQA